MGKVSIEIGIAQMNIRSLESMYIELKRAVHFRHAVKTNNTRSDRYEDENHLSRQVNICLMLLRARNIDVPAADSNHESVYKRYAFIESAYLNTAKRKEALGT